MAIAEDRSNVLPLESLSPLAVPLTVHNLSWSPDAELAIAADDCVWIYCPEFPSEGTISPKNHLTESDTQHQYYEATLRFPAVELRRPQLNEHLFTTVKQAPPHFRPGFGAGSSVISNIGSSLNHVVVIEWSPSGLGRSKRAVLGVLTGSGALNIYCEGISRDAVSVKVKGRNLRTISSWVVPWGVGGNLLVPRAVGHESPYSREFITSFAWARELDNGALLAYMTDENEIVILSVQSRHNGNGKEGDPGKWRVEEVARFMGDGPHPKGDPADPDYSPSGSSFALSWSPWWNPYKKPGTKATVLSYVTKNYVGFRQITIKGWKAMETPKLEVQPFDASGICLYLAPDAFVVWEDLVWTVGTSKVCRGVIATPAKPQAFQVSVDASSSQTSHNQHSTDKCGTTYSPDDEADQASNPITGLVIHPPNLSQSTSSPYFSLVRLSATQSNSDWYQSNLPLPSSPEEPTPKPRWAADISNVVNTMKPFSVAHRAVRPEDKERSDVDPDEDEVPGNLDGMDLDGEEDFDEVSEYNDSDEEFNKSEYLRPFTELQNMEEVHTDRVRIWGMTSSPGGGVTAVFITLNSAVKPERHTFAGLRCRVLFGQSLAPVDNSMLSMKKLSTEARTWEWMYGGGPPVPGVGEAGGTNDTARKMSTKEKFWDIANAQVCVFDHQPLALDEKMARCAKGHTFQCCAATGVPILSPGISNTCGVCGSKCLKVADLQTLAGDLASSIDKEISDEFCGSCGGRFIN